MENGIQRNSKIIDKKLFEVDPDLQAVCPECGCEGIYEVDLTGVLVVGPNGPEICFWGRYPNHRTLTKKPLIEPDLDVVCSHCGHDMFLGELVDEPELEGIVMEDE
ncbi:hypothetical protein OAV29_01120 [Candidatus Poseidoniaceae archaeon]|nr:hypothetical protein [Candidatus Poseidoniaceae archaeon]